MTTLFTVFIVFLILELEHLVTVSWWVLVGIIVADIAFDAAKVAFKRGYKAGRK